MKEFKYLEIKKSGEDEVQERHICCDDAAAAAVVEEMEQTLKVNPSGFNGQTMFHSSNCSHRAVGSDWKNELTNTSS